MACKSVKQLFFARRGCLFHNNSPDGVVASTLKGNRYSVGLLVPVILNGLFLFVLDTVYTIITIVKPTELP